MTALWAGLARQTSLAAALFYICYFAVTGFQLFNMTAWLGTRGVDAVTAGRMQGAADVLFVAGILLAGLLADWKGFNRRLYLGFFALALGGYVALGISDQIWILTLALGLITFAFMPLTNLLDTHLQPYVSRNLLPYARIRALGSLAFTFVILVSASLSETGITQAFYPTILVFACLAGLSLLALPAHPVHVPAPLLARFKTFAQLLREPKFILFYLAVALIFGSHGAYYIYAVPIWRDLGFGSEKIYMLIAWGVIIEILLFMLAPKALTEQRAAPLLALCAGAGVVRWLLWPFAEGWVSLLLIQSLHVFTFALVHLTALSFLRRRVPEAQLGAAQALMPAISVGFGLGGAKLVAAQFIDQGAVPAFWAMATIAACALPLLYGLWRLTRRRGDQPSIPA